jgi:hypothetical protein
MRWTKVAFVVVFLGVLIIPLLDTLFPYLPQRDLAENRNPAPFPDLIKILHGDGRFAPGLNRWFDDYLRLRGLLIRAKNQLDFSLFSHSEKLYLGRDKWLFDRTAFANKVLMMRAGDTGAKRVHGRLLALADYLSRRNIPLIIISNPEKETIYPQLVPTEAPRLPADDGFQQLRQFLAGGTSWDYIDGQDLLKGCMAPRPFNIADIHMTMAGGLCFARELVRRIAAAEGRPSPWDHEFTFSLVTSYAGGQVEFLSILRPYATEFVQPSIMYGPDAPGPEGAFAVDPAKVFEWTYHTSPPYYPSKLPSMVMFGDSFLDHYLNAGIFTYFKDVYRARDDGKNLETVLRSIPQGTRYFVYQFLERSIGEIGLEHSTDDLP